MRRRRFTTDPRTLVVFLASTTLALPATTARAGACCLGDATCVNTEAADCTALDGEFIGPKSECGTVICEGACCSGDEAKGCLEASRDECAATSGLFRGAGTTCEVACPALLGTTFTYQGQLKKNGVPITESIDVQVLLFPVAEGGASIDVQDVFNVPVVNGLFSVELDFGEEAFAGSERWLEVAVRVPHDPTDQRPFQTLNPRQPVRAAPYAIHSRSSQRPFRPVGTDAILEGGSVGIGTSAPDTRLHVAGTDNNGNTATLKITSGSQNMLLDGNEIDSDSSVGLHLNNNVSHDVSLAKGGGSVGIGSSAPFGAKLQVRSDDIGIGGPVFTNDDIVVESDDAVIGIYSSGDGRAGSALSLKEISRGNLVDHWGIYRRTSARGSSLRFTYGPDRNYDVNPQVVTFSPDPGPGSVTLPDEAVSSREMFDEPGIARDTNEDVFTALPDGEWTTLAARTIDCPDDGFLLAIATVNVSNGSASVGGIARLVVTQEPFPSLTIDSRRQVELQVKSPLGPIFLDHKTVTLQNVFQVDAGPQNVFLHGHQHLRGDGDGHLGAFAPELTVVYLPTAYGTVDLLE